MSVDQPGFWLLSPHARGGHTSRGGGPAQEPRIGVDAPATRLTNAGPRDGRYWYERPGAPLVALFAGYPIWWVLGLTQPAITISCVVMAFELLKYRRLTVPHGFGIWLLFLFWVSLGVLVTQVDAPGAVEGVNTSRYLTWGFRLLWYLEATVVLLYIGNLRSRLPLDRVARIFATMFLWVVGGGLLGFLLPHLDFRSVVEIVLPPQYTSIPFVNSLVHPDLVEHVSVLGETVGRPSAPFPYTNVWGLAYGCFLPFFLRSWFAPDAGWRRVAAPFVLAASVVPVIYSLNRGLWGAIVVLAVFFLVRSAAAGRRALVAVLLVGAIGVAAAVAFTPLGTRIEARFNTPNSNQGRSNLARLGIDSMSQKSPIVGFGSTRYVQGNFDSIAGGASPSCPRCVLPSLGTQGQLSLLTFCTGWGGAVLYVLFFLLQLLRHIRLRAPDVTLGLSVLLVHAVTFPVYSMDNISILPLFAAVAFLWRADEVARDEVAAARPRQARRPALDLAAYLGFVRRHRGLLAAGLVVGAVAGLAVQLNRGVAHESTISVILPADPVYPNVHSVPATLDTEAALVDSSAVRRNVAKAVGPETSLLGSVTVTADPNSRIMNLTVSGPSQAVAATAVSAAADGLLDVRQAQLAAERKAVTDAYNAQADALSNELDALDTATHKLEAAPGLGQQQAIAALFRRRYAVATLYRQANTQAQRVSSTPLAAGRVIHQAAPHPIPSRWALAVTNGIALGFVLALLLGAAADRFSPRLRREARVATFLRDLPEPTRVWLSDDGTVIETSDRRSRAGSGTERPRARAVQGGDFHADAFVSVDGDRTACRVADVLDGTALRRAATPVRRFPLRRAGAATALVAGAASRTGTRSTQRVVLVASTRTRVRDLLRAAESLQPIGARATGVILVDPRRTAHG